MPLIYIPSSAYGMGQPNFPGNPQPGARFGHPSEPGNVFGWSQRASRPSGPRPDYHAQMLADLRAQREHQAKMREMHQKKLADEAAARDAARARRVKPASAAAPAASPSAFYPTPTGKKPAISARLSPATLSSGIQGPTAPAPAPRNEPVVPTQTGAVKRFELDDDESERLRQAELADAQGTKQYGDRSLTQNEYDLLSQHGPIADPAFMDTRDPLFRAAMEKSRDDASKAAALAHTKAIEAHNRASKAIDDWASSADKIGTVEPGLFGNLPNALRDMFFSERVAEQPNTNAATPTNAAPPSVTYGNSRREMFDQPGFEEERYNLERYGPAYDLSRTDPELRRMVYEQTHEGGSEFGGLSSNEAQYWDPEISVSEGGMSRKKPARRARFSPERYPYEDIPYWYRIQGDPDTRYEE